MTPPEIATACESAGVEGQRELLMDAFVSIRPFDPQDFDAAFAFREMLDAEAYLDAVMMLKPEGCRVRVDIMEDGCGGAWVWWPTEYAGLTTPRYATPALALLAAICRDLGGEG